jgi:hypothetical protein
VLAEERGPDGDAALGQAVVRLFARHAEHLLDQGLVERPSAGHMLAGE